MLGAIIMFVIGFRAKRFKWWHAILLLVLAGLAVQLRGTRLRVDGYTTGPNWMWATMFQQTLIETVAYLASIWLGIAWAARKAIKDQSERDDDE